MTARRVVVVAVGCAFLAGCASTAPRPEKLAVFAAGKRLGTATASNVERFRLPARLRIRQGRARLIVAIPAAPARRAMRKALAARRSRLDLRVAFVSSSIAIRPVRQVLHNDCEATALSMILAGAGRRIGQLALQAQLPPSGPLNPVAVAGSSLFRWGDPERGFVGFADGGGTGGGFGVYEPPIRALAARHGVHFIDLHHRSVGALRAVVLQGHPVLAWVGLAAGPYLHWLAPDGREISANLNEHTVAVVGAGPGYVLVDNPLSGARERWSESVFSYRWRLLGRRALELPGS